MTEYGQEDMMMKRDIGLSILLVVVTLALLLVSRTQAADVSLSITCVDHSQPDRAIIHFGYFASETMEGTSYIGPVSNFAGDMPPNTLIEGQHDDVFTVELLYSPVLWQFVASDNSFYELSVDVATEGPDCANLDGWKPGAPSIYIPLESDCAFIEIRDQYNHWHPVESDGERVLLHYGESLIGGPGQSTDPADYRATATACF